MKTVYAHIGPGEVSTKRIQNIFMDNANVDQRSWPVVTEGYDTESALLQIVGGDKLIIPFC